MKVLFNTVLLFLFISPNPLFAEESMPSFSFSETKGLQPLSAPALEKQKPEKFEEKESSLEGAVKAEGLKAVQNVNTIQDIKTEEMIDSKTAEEIEVTPVNTLSEDFAPKEAEHIEGTGFLDSFLGDASWFFEKKKTKHKLAVTPDYSYNTTEGSRLGLRFFAYSSDKKGYYFALSGSQYLFRPFNRFNISYFQNRRGVFRTESTFIYDNHYEEYFSGSGMKASLFDIQKLYAHRFIARHKMVYQPVNQKLYFALEPQLFFRKERIKYHKKNKEHSPPELFVFLKASTGYDSRDNWKDPKKGVFHQVSFGCKALLDYENMYCKGEGDFRFYIPLFKDMDIHPSLKNSIWALRAFAGSSFFNPSSYSMTYSLGGKQFFQNRDTIRGFKKNRFRGEKIYFAQTEFRFPVWSKYIEAVLFTELGEVADYKKSFQSFVVDYGGGLRFALPPTYDMKIRCDYGAGIDKQRNRNHSFVVSFFHAF